MSNHKKQISIKPIETIIPPANTDYEDAVDEQHQLLKAILLQKQELAAIQEQQQKRMDEADNQIKEARDQWETEKQKLIEEAQHQGFQKGYEDGNHEAFQQYENKLKEANHIIDIAKEDYHQTLEKHAESIVELSMTVANKVLHHALKEQPDYIMELVQAGIEDVKAQPSITIVVHPNYYDEVHSHQEELQRLAGDETKLSIHADAHIQSTDCIIEHPHGQVETSVDTQLGKIRTALMDYVMEDVQ